MLIRLAVVVVLGLIMVMPTRAGAVDDCAGNDPRKVVMGCLVVILDHVSGKHPLSDEDRATVYYNVAVAEEDLGKIDKAIEFYGTAIEIDSTYSQALVGRAALLVDRGDNDAAIADLDRAITLKPREPEFYYHRGRAYRGNGRFDEAVAEFTKAIELDPHPIFYNARGSTRFAARRLDDALSDFDKVVELDPTMSVGHTNRGAIFVEKGEFEKAVASFGRAIDVSPKILNSYTDRAQAYLKMGKPMEALEDCDAALTIDPDFSLGLYVRGLVNEALGRKESAIADFTHHYALEPDSELGKEALERLGSAE